MVYIIKTRSLRSSHTPCPLSRGEGQAHLQAFDTGSGGVRLVARWVRVVAVWLGCVMVMSVQGQAQVQVGEALRGLGMENIRIRVEEGRVTAAFEDNVYRGTYRGIGEALKAALDAMVSTDGRTLELAALDAMVSTDGRTPEPAALDAMGETGEQTLELVALDNGVPRLSILVPPALVAAYRDGSVDMYGVYAAMQLSYDTDPGMRRLQGTREVRNRSRWKTDVVVYPGLTLQNFRLDRLYSYAVTLSPAVELSPWKGARFTAQVVIPVATNMQGEYRKIRPGVLALTQEFRLPSNFIGQVSAGNFTDNRLGGQAGIRWFTSNGRLELAGQAGCTVYSGLRDGEGWYISTRRRVDGSFRASIYEPRYNLRFDLQAARYVFGDVGARADCTRYFGEVAIGIYAMVTEGITNGGFHFTVPLPGRKWKREQPVRIRPAAYFAAEYSREPPGDYITQRMGYTYHTRPDDNRSEHFYQPEYTRYYLLKENR